MFEDLLTNFSIKRLIALSVIIITAYSVFLIYDNYTGSFGIGRLQRATVLLDQLVQLKEKGAKEDNDLGPLYSQITSELSKSLRISSRDSFLSKVGRFWVKFFAAGLPWYLIVFFIMRDSVRKGQKLSDAIIGGASIVLIFSLIGGAFPTAMWPVFNLVIYPILQVVVVFVPMIIYFLIKAKKAAKEEAGPGTN